MGPFVNKRQKWILATMKSGYRMTVSRDNPSAFLHHIGGLEESIPVNKEVFMHLVRQDYVRIERESEAGIDYVVK